MWDRAGSVKRKGTDSKAEVGTRQSLLCRIQAQKSKKSKDSKTWPSRW